MRIRKHASKVLGTANVFPAYSPPPVAQIWLSPQPHADTGLFCDLNRSPWDVMPAPHSPAANHLRINHQEMEKGVEDGDNMRNGIRYDEKPTSVGPTSPTIVSVQKRERRKEEDKNDIQRKEKGSKKRKRSTKEKGNEKSKASSTEDAVINTRCKKSDGKTWKCKRRAQHPHTLCEYHLNQVRSYNNGNKLTHKIQPPGTPVKKQRRTTADGEAATVARSSYVFYYNGFGPWWGKSRGRDGGGGGSGAGETKEEKQVEAESKGNLECEDGEDGEDDPMVGDVDACNIQDNAEDDRGRGRYTNGDDNSVVKDYGDDGEDSREKEINNYHLVKRKRKRIKARSLKSLI